MNEWDLFYLNTGLCLCMYLLWSLKLETFINEKKNINNGNAVMPAWVILDTETINVDNWIAL